MTNRRMTFRLLKYSRMVLITAGTSRGMAGWDRRLPYHTAEAARPCRTARSGAEESPEPRHGEVHDEGDDGHPHHGMHLGALAADELDEAVGHEARADPVGDGVGE